MLTNMRTFTACSLVVVLVATGCGDDADSAAEDLCAHLAGATFVTDGGGDELEFYEDEAWWWSGDTVETGGWTCGNNAATWLDGSFGGELTEDDARLILTEPDGFRWTGPELEISSG